MLGEGLEEGPQDLLDNVVEPMGDQRKDLQEDQREESEFSDDSYDEHDLKEQRINDATSTQDMHTGASRQLLK